jgi:predicted metal-dependent peptidase
MKKYKHSALTPQQLRAWNDTRVALLWQCPAFTHVLYTMMDKGGSEHIALFTSEVPIAATDGATLLLNPETFFAYNLQERVFICAHEIMHCVLDHCGTGYKLRRTGKVPFPDGSELPYDHQTMNVATDLVINDVLVQSKIGLYNKKWLHDTKLATHKDSAIDAYRKVYQQGNSNNGGQSGFDEHLDPGAADGKDAQQATNERSAQEWRTAVEAGAAAARAQGKLPAGSALSDFFDKVLKPDVPWADKIEAFFARKVGSGSFDWRRPNRRLIVRDIYAPGNSGKGAGLVVVAVDTSGSIVADPALLRKFFAEMSGILDEVKPRRLMVMWIDAAVHAVDEVEEATDLKSLKPKGGGGTDFRPAFTWLEAEGLEPDALVYLTDGYGSFPTFAPPYAVLWGNISPELKPEHYPFGEVVTIPVPKAA